MSIAFTTWSRAHRWLAAAALVAGCGARPLPTLVDRPADVVVEEATIDGLQAAQVSGRITARRLTELSLARIEAIDRNGPTLRSVIEVNPDALALADTLDTERRQKGPRGPLHGIPVLIKDNIDTADRMMTTAGSLALVGPAPDRDAFIVERLRSAGAVILGKTNLSEWANIRSPRSTSGWSARGGLVRNPYALDHNACGSSSGTGAAIAASLAVAGVGTETDGSIVCPSSANALVGIKPTLGLLSRSGIVPIAHSQDTPGPMARTVRDAALLLDARVGPDPRDGATGSSVGKWPRGLARALRPDALKGARIGVLRGPFSGYDAAADRAVDAAVTTMRRLGAEVIDPVVLPHAGQYGESELDVLLYELKADLNAYLATRRGLRVRTLADLIVFNQQNAETEMPHFGQEFFVQAQALGSLGDERYRSALSRNRRLAGAEGIDALLKTARLDALVALTTGPAWPTDLARGDNFSGSSAAPAAVAGYPSITVPAGWVGGLPVGISFFAGAWAEPRLIGLAYAFEQATRHRVPPTYPPTTGARVQLTGR